MRYYHYSKESTRIEKEYRVFKGLTESGCCIICGDTFKSRSSKALYCSLRCKNDSYIMRRKEKAVAKREKHQLCSVCQNEIEQSSLSKVRIYCSSKCKQKAHRNKNRPE